MVAFANFLGTDVNFYNIQKKEQIIAFLDTKIKNTGVDQDKKWITTWNHNLHRIKHFFRWLTDKILIHKGDIYSIRKRESQIMVKRNSEGQES
jgi:hypothetical protein